MRRSASTTVLAVLSAGLIAASALPAAAGESGQNSLAASAGAPVTVAEHLAGPLTFDVTESGILYVGQSAVGVLTRFTPGSASVNLFSDPDLNNPAGDGLTGVSERGGAVTWAETLRDGRGEVSSTDVKRRSPAGTITQIADTFAYEQTKNPDSVSTYGIMGLSPTCLATLPDGYAPHSGTIDSHPYGTVTGSTGSTYVADQRANALLRIDSSGHVSTVAVLPGASFVITPAYATSQGLNSCVVGHTDVLEPGPTDVAIGPDGKLYVTTVPFTFPESALALGAVYRVNPKTGAIARVASGLSGATSLAIAPNGTIFVTELYRNRVSKISHGTVTPYISLTEPAAVEWASGHLYVATNISTDGKVVRLP